MMLLSRVKVFLGRFKGRFYAGDSNMFTPAALHCASLEDLDCRDSPAFSEVDQLLSSFYASFPSHLRNPVHDGLVDCYLYTACSATQLCVHPPSSQHSAEDHFCPSSGIILLHEPHAILDSPTCISATKILNAARFILDLLYKLASTSFDVSLLDSLPFVR